MVLLTVFTPTYNRAHTLPEAYCSLKAQTSKNFLWLIVDDGSTDRTAALVSAWMQAEKAFTIRYLYRCLLYTSSLLLMLSTARRPRRI